MPVAGYRATFTDTLSRPCPTVEGAFMPNRNLTNTARLKGRELLRRPRFPALFPADRGALKPWTVGEGYLYRLDYRDFWLTSGDYILVSAQIK